MNVLLVSECDKRALRETRRILDQFAERRGERTWQTVITQAGLDTLRRLLRQSARRNTAVACHWIRGLDHSELLWIVGDRSRFNAQGAVPTDTTRRNVLRTEDENDWQTGEDIVLLAQLAALLHDLGKASEAFQQRLRGKWHERNAYRHEWVSLRLFLAFVGQDDDAGWLARMAELPAQEPESAADVWLQPGRYWRDGLDDLNGQAQSNPFRNLPPLAAAVAWLIVTHHRLPVVPSVNDAGRPARMGSRLPIYSVERLGHGLDDVTAGWNEWPPSEAPPKDVAAYWACADRLPVHLPQWQARAARLARRLQALRARPDKGGWLDNPYVMHLARLSLMLADHHYSSLQGPSPQRLKGDAGCRAHANTDAQGRLNQPLDEHLLGVARDAGRISHALPDFARYLRHLRSPLLRRRSGAGRFHWQDLAADRAAGLREAARLGGGFCINMASTGCGKTLANARIMHALADPEEGMRCSFALGLRTLTLQTGRSYRHDLGLGDEDLAVRVGGAASRALFEYYEQQAERTGSASSQSLIDADAEVLYEGPDELARHHGLLGIALQDRRIRDLLAAPVLVCTIDHLMPATEAQRAGHQIAPMLRLLSSDVVLDELDDFDLDDMPALTRLVYWIGLLGGRLLISSATLPPALVEGMFQAYRQGRQQWARNHGAGGAGEACVQEVACLWVDEFGAQAQSCGDMAAFVERHRQFVEHRVQALRDVPARRMGRLLPLELSPQPETEAFQNAWAMQVRDAMLQAHAAHAETVPGSGQRVSFGMVRMAHIDPLVDTARALYRLGAPEGFRIHLCVYHAAFPLALRSAIEHQLDQACNRRQPQEVFALPLVQERLAAHPEHEHLFVVLTSPVSEVGRDWDLDWAVVEPSSMRSLIQLAGRVQRHRQQPCTEPNILIFDTNLRHLRQPERAAFCRPGFEAEPTLRRGAYTLASHRLEDLLQVSEYQPLDACPRIQPRPRESWQPTRSLVDLEHARLVDTLLPHARTTPVAAAAAAQPTSSRRRSRGGSQAGDHNVDACSIWEIPRASLTWTLPQQQPFRAPDGAPDVDLVFLPDDDTGALYLHRVENKNDPRKGLASPYVPEEDAKGSGCIEHIDLAASMGPGIQPWVVLSLPDMLAALAQHHGQDMRQTAIRFAGVQVRASPRGWRYHPVLGFSQRP